MIQSTSEDKYNKDFFVERVFEVLTPIANRILIEARRQQSLIEHFNQPESKATFGAIEVQWNQIERISKIVTALDKTTPDNFNNLSNELRTLISQLSINQSSYTYRWKLTPQEKTNLTNSINNLLAIKSKKINQQNSKSNFEKQKHEYEKSNPLKVFFGKLTKKEKDDVIRVDYNHENGRKL